MPARLFEADCLPPEETLQTAQGALAVSRERNLSYADKYRQMREAGIKIPLFWGHQMRRDGPFHVDDRATERARWQAGDVEAFAVDPSGVMKALAEVPPGCDVDPDSKTLIDPINHTRHSRVSVGIGDWKDGTGKWWRDVPVHVAITPLPVWVWQDGFRAADRGQVLACSADSRVRVRYVLGAAMPIPKKPDDEDEETPEAEDAPAAAPEETDAPDGEEAEAPAESDGPGEGEQPAAEGTEGETNPLEEAAQPTDGEQEPELGDMPNEQDEAAPESESDPEIKGLVEQFGQLGIPGLEGMTRENGYAMISGAIGGLLAAGACIKVGEHELDKGGEKPQAESPPLFMLSTAEPTPTGMTDREWRMAQRLGEQAQNDRRTRIEALRTAGVCDAVCDRLREQGTRFHLGDAGDVTFPEVDARIAELEEVAAGYADRLEKAEQVLTATLSTADPKTVEVDTPEERAANGERLSDAEMKEVAERMYGKGAEPGKPKFCNP